MKRALLQRLALCLNQLTLTARWAGPDGQHAFMVIAVINKIVIITENATRKIRFLHLLHIRITSLRREVANRHLWNSACLYYRYPQFDRQSLSKTIACPARPYIRRLGQAFLCSFQLCVSNAIAIPIALLTRVERRPCPISLIACLDKPAASPNCC